jgi:hypothetical protein
MRCRSFRFGDLGKLSAVLDTVGLPAEARIGG